MSLPKFVVEAKGGRILLREMPVILTKDRDFAHEWQDVTLKPGVVVTLPEDAILVAFKGTILRSNVQLVTYAGEIDGS